MKETCYIKRNSDCSNDIATNANGKYIVPEEIDPKKRWLWVTMWTSEDKNERYNRFDFNFEYNCWVLEADDYPQLSRELEKAMEAQLTDEILTKLYNREITTFEITV